MPSVKQDNIKYHFLSLWYDSTWNWTQISRAIGEHSNHYAKDNITVQSGFFLKSYHVIGTGNDVKCIELLDDPTDWKMIKVKICQNTPGKRKEEKKGKKRREKEKENDSSNISYILINASQTIWCDVPTGYFSKLPRTSLYFCYWLTILFMLIRQTS